MEAPQLPLWASIEGIPGRQLKLAGLNSLSWPLLLESQAASLTTSQLGTLPEGSYSRPLPTLLPICLPYVPPPYQATWRPEPLEMDTALRPQQRSTGDEKRKESIASKGVEGLSHPKNRERRWSRWKPDEDEKLLELIESQGLPTGPSDWGLIARLMDGRTQSQCRSRWKNYLRPDVSREPWTAEEDARLLELQARQGNTWSCFVEQFPGRTYHAIKNRFAPSLTYPQMVRLCPLSRSGRQRR